MYGWTYTTTYRYYELTGDIESCDFVHRVGCVGREPCYFTIIKPPVCGFLVVCIMSSSVYIEISSLVLCHFVVLSMYESRTSTRIWRLAGTMKLVKIERVKLVRLILYNRCLLNISILASWGALWLAWGVLWGIARRQRYDLWLWSRYTLPSPSRVIPQLEEFEWAWSMCKQWGVEMITMNHLGIYASMVVILWKIGWFDEGPEEA